MPTPIERLNIDELDALIAVTYQDITWHSPSIANRIWNAIDRLLDRRLELTKVNQ